MKNPIVDMKDKEIPEEGTELVVKENKAKTWIRNNWKKVAKTAALVGAGVVGTLLVVNGTKGRDSDDDDCWADTDETQYLPDDDSESGTEE